ncbi:MAG: hypothetical protein OXU20_31950 [Myxococcales bacterium]|nr:hypothetical protein [Myxococcales bacterium]
MGRRWVMLLGTLLGGCAMEVDGADVSASQQAASRRASSAPAVAPKQTLVEGIETAENLLFTSDGRLFASSDRGVFEIVQGDTDDYQASTLLETGVCAGGGLAQVDNTLYVNCYDFADSYLYAAELTATPAFEKIHDMPGMPLANGLAGHPDGYLFVADTLRGQIHRLSIDEDDPMNVADQEVWLSTSGLLTNGITYHAGSLYWTALATVRKAAIRPNGRPGRVETVVYLLTFFDDLYVDSESIAATDYLGGRLVLFDHEGNRLQRTGLNFLEAPSAVLPSLGRLGLPDGSWVVTERGGGRLSLVTF